MYNVVATPGALYRYWRQGQAGGRLAAAVLAGLTLNAAAGLWWADPAAGYVLVYYAAREARQIFFPRPGHRRASRQQAAPRAALYCSKMS